MRILVSGPRDWQDRAAVEADLNLILLRTFNRHPDISLRRSFTLVHGACPTGVDYFAEQWAGRHLAQGVKIERVEAKWSWHCAKCPGHRITKQPGDILHPGNTDDYCPAQGPIRNRKMVGMGADLAVVYLLPWSRGSKNCLRLIRSVDIPVIVRSRNQHLVFPEIIPPELAPVSPLG